MDHPASGPGERFASKRDGWLTVVIWVGVAACVAGGLAAAFEGGVGPVIGTLLLLLLLASAAFMLWVLYGTHYSFASDMLLIRSGPLRLRVPLADIDSVVPSRNPLSSPACSLDRLLVRYGSRRVLISPEDKQGFLRLLVRHCPQLELHGDRVARRGGTADTSS